VSFQVIVKLLFVVVKCVKSHGKFGFFVCWLNCGSESSKLKVLETRLKGEQREHIILTRNSSSKVAKFTGVTR